MDHPPRTPQSAAVAEAAVVRAYTEVLGQQPGPADGVAHGLHRADGASHGALIEDDEHRADGPGLHLAAEEREAVFRHQVREDLEPLRLWQFLVLQAPGARGLSGAMGEVLELDSSPDTRAVPLRLVGAEEPDDADLPGAMGGGELASQAGAGRQAVRRRPVDVHLDDGPGALGEGRDQRPVPVVHDGVRHDALGLRLEPSLVLVVGQEAVCRRGLDDGLEEVVHRVVGADGPRVGTYGNGHHGLNQVPGEAHGRTLLTSTRSRRPRQNHRIRSGAERR